MTPGEVSLAHKGILFFDELTEFPRETLEVLRQPLEDQVITISRVNGSIQYPADVMFVAAMNPCLCGYFKDPQKPCSCSLLDVKRYQSKISGPLLDRIDMILEVPREQTDTLLTLGQGENSESLRQRVVAAWGIQQKRFASLGITSNSAMNAQYIDELVILNQVCKDFLIHAAQKFLLSPRIVHRMMKLARTIADMDGREDITVQDLAEALQYRSKTFFVEEVM